MTKFMAQFICLILVSGISAAYAQSTARTPEFSNNKTNVWKTIIYPESNQGLSMHRHDYDRVIVALSNGVLKITSDTEEVHYLKLKKHQAYYLEKDAPHALHQDENITKRPIIVMVIELKE